MNLQRFIKKLSRRRKMMRPLKTFNMTAPVYEDAIKKVLDLSRKGVEL